MSKLTDSAMSPRDPADTNLAGADVAGSPLADSATAGAGTTGAGAGTTGAGAGATGAGTAGSPLTEVERWHQQERAEDLTNRAAEQTHLRRENSSSFTSAAMSLVRAVYHIFRRPLTTGRRFAHLFAALGRWLAYGAWLLAEVVINADIMALDMFRPNTKISPAILRVPLERMNSLEVTVFAISITLTPGTLVLAIDRGSAKLTMTLDGVAVSGDNGFLLVHSVYAEDLDVVRDELEIMMNKVLQASRGSAYEPHSLEVTAA